jgi:hypothetical protein
MPRKVFEAFTRLDASDVNTYLMDQSVQTFADSAARGSAIGTATEGMVTYLNDTNSVELWDGSSWTAVGGSFSRNYVLNSNMTVLQRGTSNVSFGATRYTADQWKVGRTGSVAGATWNINTPTSLTGFKNATNIIRDSGNTSTANLTLSQPFENAGFELRGKTVTLSFYAIKGTNYSAAGDALVFGFQSSSVAPESVTYNQGGKLNSGNADLDTQQTTVTLQATWTRFSHTFTVPTTANASIVFFDFTPVGTAGANDFYRITGVQLEEGSIATSYKPNGSSYAEELASCQRYFVKHGGSTNWGLTPGYASGTTSIRATIPTPVTMRADPTITDSNTSVRTGSSSLTPSATTVNAVVSTGVQVAYTVTGATANAPAVVAHGSDLALSAEL